MRDETKMAAKETNYSLSQNCWDIFVSSRLLSVDVHDLVTESQAKGGGGGGNGSTKREKTTFALSVPTIFVWDCRTMALAILQTTVSRTLFFKSVFNTSFYKMSTVKTSDVVF